MNVHPLIRKGARRVAHKWVYATRKWPFYPYLYRATWRAMLRGPVPAKPDAANWLTAIPNPGAGIGHQLANWIAGYWFARRFGLRFAHTPFPLDAWERTLGLGEGEVAASDLRLRRVRLPLFDEDDAREVARIRAILAAYPAGSTLFVLERDQFYRAQIGVREDLRAKFHAAPARAQDALIFKPGRFAIAVHIRRGDVTLQAAATNSNLAMRYQDERYFETVLDQVMAVIDPAIDPDIYLFSQGSAEELAPFRRFPNLRMCLDMGPRESFAHMAQADLLITSKSSFSYKPALMSDGVKIVPTPFWHDYPDAEDWVLADAEGRFDAGALKRALGGAGRIARAPIEQAAHDPA